MIDKFSAVWLTVHKIVKTTRWLASEDSQAEFHSDWGGGGGGSMVKDENAVVLGGGLRTFFPGLGYLSFNFGGEATPPNQWKKPCQGSYTLTYLHTPVHLQLTKR